MLCSSPASPHPAWCTVYAQISVPKEEEGWGGTGAQSKLYYWKEADWYVVGVCQRWSTLTHDLLNSSACMYAHEGGRQRENFTCQNVCVRAKVFALCAAWAKADGTRNRTFVSSLKMLICKLVTPKLKDDEGERQIDLWWSHLICFPCLPALVRVRHQGRAGAWQCSSVLCVRLIGEGIWSGGLEESPETSPMLPD